MTQIPTNVTVIGASGATQASLTPTPTTPPPANLATPAPTPAVGTVDPKTGLVVTADTQTAIAAANGAAAAAATTTSTTSGAFDPLKFEKDFGLAAGSLAGITTEAAAIAKVREITNRALVLGLMGEDEDEVEDPAAAIVATPAASAASTAAAMGTQAPPTGGETVEQRLARLEAANKQLQDTIAENQHNAQENIRKHIKQRFTATVDSWASAEYGVSGSRTYKQTQRLKGLESQLNDFVKGAVKGKEQLPVIETVALRLRAVDDPEGFDKFIAARGTAAGAMDPNAAPATLNGSAPLGTPGNQKKMADGSARNIHEAVFVNGRFVSGSAS